MRPVATGPQHPVFSRRFALQAGAISLLGLGSNHLAGLRALGGSGQSPARSVIYIFLSGGLSQLDSFDLKPEAPDTVRGQFKPIATREPGVQICEHLPMLAQQSQRWSLVRSLTHPWNEHSQGHLAMLTGRSTLPPTFSGSKPMPADWPAIAAVAGNVTRPRNNLPPAVVLPETLVHRTGRVIPGQFAGQMGVRYDPWVVKASTYNPTTYGAYPEYGFHHQRGAENPDTLDFQAPNLTLPEGLSPGRVERRFDLLSTIERQRREMEQTAAGAGFDRYRQQAVSLLADPTVQHAFDVKQADAKVQERYGRNQFGWSLLMARRLVEAGVNLVQVNLGNNETWDTHQNAFKNLSQFLFPPADRAVSALLEDLDESGLLESTLVVMAGEFGRTPRVSMLSGAKGSGRDHWGAVQTVLLAGGGLQGGRVIGSSDKLGGHPADSPQTPENLGATIYQSLGIPQTAHWTDPNSRPHFVYHGDPILGLT